MSTLDRVVERRTVRRTLAVTGGEALVALLAMGYPAETRPAPTRDPVADHLREVEGARRRAPWT
jgi:hypothetical protein